MIKIEKTEVWGWGGAIRGMRNPLNSWDKMDSCNAFEDCTECPYCNADDCASHDPVGKNDITLMKKLVKAGSDHRKFMRFITVSADITAPLYWWKEYDTYKVGTVANSCSTMHTIHKKEFELTDFSFERLVGLYLEQLKLTIECLNNARDEYLDTKDKFYWWQMIQLLPTSYNQKRTVLLNYEVLRNMYHSRKAHKLDEWISFCEWVKTLPYSELITE